MKEGRKFPPPKLETLGPVSKSVSKASRTCGACGAIVNLRWATCLACGIAIGGAPETSVVIEPANALKPDSDTYAVILAVPPGCPEDWCQGVADLLARVRPVAWPETEWRLLREDAFVFLRDRGAEAVRLGWDVLDLFGVDPRAPLARYDAMGLAVLLRGRRVVELHHDRAVIEDHQGQRTSFTRHPAPTARVLIWELDRRSV